MSTPNAPTIVVRPSPQISAIRLVLAIVAVLVALVLGLLVLLVIGIETGPVALLLGLVTATIPVPLYVVLVLWIDRYEAEPLWMLATAFFWGALVSTFFAFILNTTSGIVVGVLTDASAGQAFCDLRARRRGDRQGRYSLYFLLLEEGRV
jgi:RsiW-degrading membrane proteinase PrsW (M82 family)